MKILILILLLFSLSLSGQQTVGLLQNDPGAEDGYVLFSNNETTYLIDKCGLILNTWQSEFKPGESVYLLENGNLLRTGELSGSFGAGGSGGMFELFDWKGELLWQYQFASDKLHAHHDIEPLPNGNFLVLAWELYTEAQAKVKGRIFDGPVWSEKIVELEIQDNNEARIVWEWSVWDHLIQDVDPSKPDYGNFSDHPERININFVGRGHATSGNWIHLNSIDYNATLNQIIVSSRLWSEVWIIDHSTTTSEASTNFGGHHNKGGDLLYRFGNPAAYGLGSFQDQLFKHQHDAHWIPENLPNGGQLMVFNNDKDKGKSSVVIWTPLRDEEGIYQITNDGIFGPDEVDWEYSSQGFYSEYMSSAQVLTNGNIFICEGMDGRFFEITSEEDVVWEYINPVNQNGSPVSQGGTPRFNQTFRATKYGLDYPAFQNRDILPISPVEINPWESECYLPEDEMSPTPVTPEAILISNFIADELNLILTNSSGSAGIKLLDRDGRTFSDERISEGPNAISVHDLPTGIYFLFVQFENGNHQTFKFLKNTY